MASCLSKSIFLTIIDQSKTLIEPNFFDPPEITDPSKNFHGSNIFDRPINWIDKNFLANQEFIDQRFLIDQKRLIHQSILEG